MYIGSRLYQNREYFVLLLSPFRILRIMSSLKFEVGKDDFRYCLSYEDHFNNVCMDMQRIR
jgi:hypothetical protein